MNIGPALIAPFQTAKAVETTQAALDHPAAATEPVAGLNPAVPDLPRFATFLNLGLSMGI
jgi:hypothetical protein